MAGYALRLEVEPSPSPDQVIVVEVLLYNGTDQHPVGSLGSSSTAAGD
jgi:hypothetical protein